MTKAKLLKDLYQSGRLSRRDFMQGAASVGLGIGAASAFVDSVAAATPRRGGSVVAASAGGATSDNLDVATWVNQHQMMTGMATNEYLTETDANEMLKPRFAESWEALDQGGRWVFNLVSGVEHSNGKTVDSEDVIGSFRYHIKDESKSSFKPQIEQIANMEADGPNRVIFTLNAPNADFPMLTSDYRAAIMPCENGVPMVLDCSIGAGPYRLENFEPGVRAMLVRNPDYWKDDVGFFESVEFLSVLDDVARQNALRSGTIQIMERGDLKTIDRLAALDGVRVISTEAKAHYAFPMNTQREPYNDVNVRTALKLAIDRKEFVDKILRGYGALGNDQPISSAYRYFDEALPQRVYDPEKARWHLKQAGYDQIDIKMTMAEAAFPGAVDAAVLYAEQAKQAGINMTVDRVPNDGYWGEVWRVADFCGCVWYGRPVEDEVLTVTYQSGGAWNDTFWSNERFDSLLAEARSELDEAKRAELYGEMQRIIHDDGGQVIPGFANWVDAVSSEIGTPDKIAGRNQLDGFRFAERWWFKG